MEDRVASTQLSEDERLALSQRNTISMYQTKRRGALYLVPLLLSVLATIACLPASITYIVSTLSADGNLNIFGTTTVSWTIINCVVLLICGIIVWFNNTRTIPIVTLSYSLVGIALVFLNIFPGLYLHRIYNIYLNLAAEKAASLPEGVTSTYSLFSFASSLEMVFLFYVIAAVSVFGIIATQYIRYEQNQLRLLRQSITKEEFKSHQAFIKRTEKAELRTPFIYR